MTPLPTAAGPATRVALATTLGLLLLVAVADAARLGVPTNLAADGTTTGASADPPGWLVLERQDSGSANGDVVKQIRFFVEVTGTTLDVRVFDAGLSGARDLGRTVNTRYRLLDPAGNPMGGGAASVTLGADTGTTQDRLARFACADFFFGPSFQTPDTPAGFFNRIWGASPFGFGNCTALSPGVYVFEATITSGTGDPTYEGRNAFGVEFLDASGNPYNAYTIGNADDTITPAAATDTSMVVGAVAGDRPVANVSGPVVFYPYVNRGCTVEPSNFDLDANNAEGNGSVATLVDTEGRTTALDRSDNDASAATTVDVEPTASANGRSVNYGMFTLTTQLDEWATAQQHVDWRASDFLGSTAGTPASFPRHPVDPIRTYLPHDYSACSATGCTMTAPEEPVLAASAVYDSGEDPPLPGGAATRFAMTASVGNPTTTTLAGVQITVPLAAEATYVVGSQASWIDGAAAACTDASTAAYRRCTFASVGPGQVASLTFLVDLQPTATGLRNLTGAPAAGSPPPDTTVWAQYTPAHQSATFPRTEILGPLCQLTANAAPTADLEVTSITDTPDPVTGGTNLTYQIQVGNLGPATAPNPSLSLPLPTGTSFVSAGGAWSCVAPPVGSAGTVTCSAPSLVSGASAVVDLVVHVSSLVASGTSLVLTATVASGANDPVSANDSQNETTLVVAPAANADLGVTKVASPDPVSAGQDIVYTVGLTNGGPATAVNATFTDVIPANTTFQGLSAPSGWSCSAPAVGGTGTVSCTRATLAVTGTATFSLRVQVDPGTPAGTTIANTATVANDVSDPVSGNDSASTATTVTATAICPTPGQDGAGGTLAGVVNNYYPGVATASAGSTSITLGAARFGGPTIAAGDLLIVMQMQDATIDSTDTDAYGDGTAGDGEARGWTALNSSGFYEYVVAASSVGAGGGTLTLTGGLAATYTAGGQSRFQVITVPQYTTATLGSSLTAAWWDGSTGGVLALDVESTLDLGGATVDLTGRGFRGGGARQLTGGGGGSGTQYVGVSTAGYHASKGEGVAGTPRWVYSQETTSVVDNGVEGYPGGSFARGAPGSAGGGGTDSNPAANDENSGGGGGANGGLGGRGGNAWNSNAPVGGFGGAAFPASGARLTLGGGGGAGTRNNSTGDQSSGSAGGAIVLIRADALAGTGTITADGASANTSDTTPANDGGGGGGAGGSVLVLAPSGGMGGLTVSARGGDGSDAWPTVTAGSYPGERHGPGGGGGGGVVILSGAPAATDVGGGVSGTTTTNPEVFGASDGSPGWVATDLDASQIVGIDTTGPCGVPDALVDLAVTVAGPTGFVDACETAAYTFDVTNDGPDTAIDATATFPIPTDTTFQSLAEPSGWTCDTPVPGGTGSVTCTNPSVPPGYSASFVLTLRVDCAATVGSVVAITGTVTTASIDTQPPNDATLTTNLVGPALEVLTRAAIRGLRVDRRGRVEFATTWQRGTASFDVFMTDDPRGLDRGVRISREAVPAPRPDSHLPILYSVETDPVTAAYLMVEETEVGGRSRLMGPFAVADGRMLEIFERIERRLVRAGSEEQWLSVGASARTIPKHRLRALEKTRRRGPGDLSPASVRGSTGRPARAGGPPNGTSRAGAGGPAGRAVKLEVSGPGPVSLDRSALTDAGLGDGAALRSCDLTVQGRRVPFEVTGEGTPGEALHFRAEPLQTTYASRNVYVLTCGTRAPSLAVPLTAEGDPARPGWIRVDPPVLYVASVPRGSDPWLWDFLYWGEGPWPYSWDPEAGDFELPGWPEDGAPAMVRLRVQGLSEHEHMVTARVNGEPIGSVWFVGSASAVLEAEVVGLKPQGNQLSLDYDNASGDPWSAAYVDYLEVQAPADWTPEPPVASPSTFDPRLPRLGVDYLIVTHSAFTTEAERLATAKRGEGLRVAVVDVERAYDRFSGGVREAGAVRELIRRSAQKGRLRYVLLLGDDSFDPDDRTGMGRHTFVPSLMGWDGVFGRVASENLYADLDDDSLPDVAVGRLPAATPEEAEVLVSKVERQAAVLAEARGRHLFAVDNRGPNDVDYRAEARGVAQRLPEDTSLAWADLAEGVAEARTQLWAGLGEGPSVVHYFGHGGPEQWADESLVTVEDAAALPPRPAVVLTWACLSQFFQYYFGPSVNEAMLLSPEGGALAIFGPAGIAEYSLQAGFYDVLYEELLRGPVPLGEAIRRAKRAALEEDPEVRPVVEGWNLLGDPALLLDMGGPPSDPE